MSFENEIHKYIGIYSFLNAEVFILNISNQLSERAISTNDFIRSILLQFVGLNILITVGIMYLKK